MESGYLDSLNFDQRRAVEYGTGDCALPGPLLVIAGAGTGKTSTLAHRVAHLIVKGADPHRVLLLTFSRRAAAEMKRRVETIVGRAAGRQVRLLWAGTFHAIGVRLLREYGRTIGLDPAFTILDREDAADLMNWARDDLGLSSKDKRFPTKATCLSIYSRAINSEIPLEELLTDVFPWCQCWSEQLKLLFTAYVEAKQEQSVLDYDDLLLYWSQAMEVAEIAQDIGGRFDHVMVDEYQDTNRLQSSIITFLKPDGHGVTVVGDDAQAIYSFRAASVRNILDFPAQYQPPAEVVTLERNYRSTVPILEASNAVIGMASERFAKRLWSERPTDQRPLLVTVPDGIDQARYVAERILENHGRGLKLKSQAALFRAGHHSAQLEIELARRSIPYIKFGGLKFLDSAHVKDIMAVLRFATNPRDRVAGFRVLQLMPGIGRKTAGKLLNSVSTSLAPVAALEGYSPPAGAASLWSDFLSLLQKLRSTLAGWPAEFDAVRNWYAPFLELGYEDPRVRMADLEQLQQIATGFASREEFLTELTLDPPGASSDEAGVPHLDDDYAILSTIHSAKGLEWTTVFVLNAVDGCIPSDLGTGTTAEIEEERRLMYVAMTRAKDELHILQPRQFFIHNQPAFGDRAVTAARTRFIPAELLGYFEQKAWPKVDAYREGTVTLSSQHAIAARVRDMWR
jgi:DNA helicase-2/ATP-dependent DNA helicase PcrA